MQSTKMLLLDTTNWQLLLKTLKFHVVASLVCVSVRQRWTQTWLDPDRNPAVRQRNVWERFCTAAAALREPSHNNRDTPATDHRLITAAGRTSSCAAQQTTDFCCCSSVPPVSELILFSYSLYSSEHLVPEYNIRQQNLAKWIVHWKLGFFYLSATKIIIFFKEKGNDWWCQSHKKFYDHC